MLARRLLCRKQLWYATSYNNCAVVQRYTQNANQLQEPLNLEMRLPAARAREPQRKPFAKNLFLGVLDHEFLYYPEPQTKERHEQFFEWLSPIEKFMSECLAHPQSVTRDDVLVRLRELGVFRGHVDERHLGLDLSQTELAKLIEVLSSLPWLGSYIVKNHIVPTHLISTLATDEMKRKYLPKIATGDILPVVCLTELNNKVNIWDFSTNAVLSDCGTYWTLNGQKSFVANAHESNIFLVFTLASHYNQPLIKSASQMLSVILVERDLNGITCEEVKALAGQHDCPMYTVTFENTKIPKENLIGKIGCGLDILVDLFAPGNRYVAPQTVGVLKTFVKLLTTHILQRKHLDRNMHEYEAIQEAIGKIAIKLYGMESMLYMTTGMIDRFENQDCTLEKAMLETYCANECVASLYEGLQIIGAQSYLRENPYIQILEDALSYTLFECYNVDSNTYISLLGLQHTGKNLREHVLKVRNPLHFPSYIIKKLFNKDHRLKLDVSGHLHPSFEFGAEMLEECLAKLKSVAIMLLERHGREISERQMELHRLSELVTITYALIAVLSRSSRAYCIGLRNTDQDRQVACSFAIFSLDRVKVLANAIEKGEWENGDKLYKNIAELMYSQKDYFAEHPLNRTF